jgi:4-hydroxybenzoate polyprenyltransferase
MKQLNLFIQITRLNRPIGCLLLFWPCLWGLTLAYDSSISINIYIFYVILFFLGSLFMRSAGCIVNDISDKNFDKKVERTKNRPIASGEMSIKIAFFYVIVLCGLALMVLINFNNITILLALASMPLAFTYPLMKRFTYWPQLFLGITFNYGLILGWTSIENEINLIPFILYFGAIFWTLGYDTVYGYQDITDDEIIGVKSTSIKFKNSPKKFLFICYSITIFSYLILGQIMEFNYFFILGALFMIVHLFFYQLKNFNSKNINQCLKIFKSNNSFGLILLIFIFLGRLNI